jgi:hypothetical protein
LPQVPFTGVKQVFGLAVHALVQAPAVLATETQELPEHAACVPPTAVFEHTPVPTLQVSVVHALPSLQSALVTQPPALFAALHEAVVPPPVPAQLHVQGPEPLSALATPALQYGPLGVDAYVPPFGGAAQTPFTGPPPAGVIVNEILFVV